MSERERNTRTCFERAGEGGEGGPLAETAAVEAEVAEDTVSFLAARKV